ncbi:MAG: YhbY family RNA-binding protein [Sulfolobales archaeon]
MVKDRKTARVIHGRPHLRIGKSGVHNGLIEEINRRLEESEVIKVRVLKSYLTSSGNDVKYVASEVAKLVKAEVVTVRGHVFVLRRRAGKGRHRK